MANRIVSVHARIYGMGIYAIMLPSSGFSFAHWEVVQGALDRVNIPCLMHDNCICQMDVKMAI